MPITNFQIDLEDAVERIDKSFTIENYGNSKNEIDEMFADKNDFIDTTILAIKQKHGKDIRNPKESFEFTMWKNQFGGKNLGTVTSEEFIKLIENSKYSSRIKKARTHVKNSDEYSKIKNSMPSFTMAGIFEGDRTLGEKIREFSSIIYIDIDKFGDKTKEEVEQILHRKKYIGEVWDSFSTKGLGCIGYTKGYMSKLNYKDTHKKIQADLRKSGIDVDPQTCNHNRVCVLSFSEVRISNTEIEPIETNITSLIKRLEDKKLTKHIFKKSDVNEYASSDIEAAMFKEINRIQKYGTIGSSNRNRPIGKFVRNFCLRVGIDYELVKEFGQKYFQNDSKSLGEFSRQLDYCYEQYDNEFGTEQDKIVQSLEREYLIPKGKYLTDIDFNIGSRTHIVSPTGSGKTTLVLKKIKGKRIVVFPTQSVLKQSKNSYKSFKMYYQLTKDTISDGDNILTTYSSLKKMLDNCSGLSISDYTLIIDENHNFAASSSRSFRLGDMNNVINLIPYFKSVITLTATPYKVLHPTFENFETITFHQEETRKIPTTFFRFADYRDCYQSILDTYEKEKKNVIFLNDTKYDGELGSLTNFLQNEGHSVCIINSKTKSMDDYDFLLRTSKLPRGHDFYIVTSLIIEATNILNTDIGNVYVLPTQSGKYLHYLALTQFLGRFRLVTPIHTHVYIKQREEEDAFYTTDATTKELIAIESKIESLQSKFDSTQTQLELIGIMKVIVDKMNEIGHSEFFMEHKKIMFYQDDMVKYLMGKDSSIFKNEQGNYEIDYCNVAYRVYELEARFGGMVCTDYLAYKLMQNNFVIHSKILSTQIEETADEEAKEFKAFNKELVEELVQEIVVNIEKDETQSQFENNKGSYSYAKESDIDLPLFARKTIETKIRKRACNLLTALEYSDVLEYFKEEGLSPTSYGRILFRINLKLREKLQKEFDLDFRFLPNALFNDIHMLATSFSDAFSTIDLKIEFNKIFKRYPLYDLRKELTSKNVMNYARQFFTIENVSREMEHARDEFNNLMYQEDGTPIIKRVYRYMIIDSQPLKLNIKMPTEYMEKDISDSDKIKKNIDIFNDLKNSIHEKFN